MTPFSNIPLPKSWPPDAKRAFLAAVALAHHAMTLTHSWCVNSRIDRVRLGGENHYLKTELAMTKEELRIKDARMGRVAPAHRPHYLPTERLAILALKAARCWNNAKAARAFQITDVTIASWLTRVEEEGVDALVKLPEPANKFPDFVGQIVRELKAVCPTMGKVRIAQFLARAGLSISASTAKRMLERTESKPTPTDPTPAPQVSAPPEPGDDERPFNASPKQKPQRTIKAKYAHHVWNIDLTLVPTAMGMWVPWLPFALLQRWPFCYCVLAIVDHFSRKCLLTKAFRSQPSTKQVTETLDLAIAVNGKAPKYIISDQGAQFREQYELWCLATGIKPRFGAIGCHGSIALTERFILSLKDECTRRILVPLRLADFQAELIAYVVWYNEHRAHQGLGGRTPNEVCNGVKPARDGPRLETRESTSNGKQQGEARRVPKLRLVVSHLEHRSHLPIVKLERAA